MNDQPEHPQPFADSETLLALAPAAGLLDDDTLSRSAVTIMWPGDTVLLMLLTDPGKQQAAAMLDHLHEAFPGVTFQIVIGAAGALVLPGASAAEIGDGASAATVPAPAPPGDWATLDGVPR